MAKEVPVNYVVCTIKPWDEANFKKLSLPGNWYILKSRDEFITTWLDKLQPKYIFFTHWSWKIPKEVYNKHTCIVFHPADLPDGRGSSIIQHRIKNGVYHTKVSALKVDSGIDTGDIYMKRDLCLNGNGEEIYLRLSEIIFEMIKEIVDKNPIPVKQEGEGTVFKHRTPDMSEIKDIEDLKKLHDFIRMLDAETYPKAFINYGNYKLEFSRPSWKTGRIIADVEIKERE